MALAGFDTPILVFSSSATNSSYGGTVTGVTAGNLYAVCLMACSDSSLNTPSSWTVTLGSDTMAYQSGQSANGVFGFTAWFTVVATGSGDLSLSVTTSNNCRSMAGYVFDITGFDTTTPIPNAGQADSHTSNTTSLTSPNGVTTSADGNAILGCVSVKGGDVTNLAVGAADGSVTGQTGGNASSDNEWGIAWDRTPTAASVTFAWTWTTSDRPGAAWIEVAEATGGAGTDTLTADDVESSSEVSAPNIGQEHALNASDVESAAEVSAPVLGQIHALTTDNVESASEVTAPALGVSHVLAADDIESVSEVTAPTIGQSHVLNASDVECASEVTIPALRQVHALTATSVESASEVSAPVLTDIAEDVDVLNAADIESASEVSAPVLGQVHVLAANDVESVSEVSAPAINAPLVVQRGDDAFRSNGARERFWRRKAEEWLEDHLEQTLRATKKKKSARKRAGNRIIAAAKAAAVEMPEIAPKIDLIARFAAQLKAPEPDLVAIATAVAAQLEQVETEKRTMRRKRDLEAVLLLAA